MSTLETIPQPPEKPLLGNILELGPSTQVQDLIRLAREYGPIYQLALPGRRLVVVSSFELVDELCDETRFDKKIWAPLQNVRGFTGDGLFTAHPQEDNWHKAHNIL
jgi:cytochrome P450/NADPH-cytochrome P450 reductase